MYTSSMQSDAGVMRVLATYVWWRNKTRSASFAQSANGYCASDCPVASSPMAPCLGNSNQMMECI